jgi:rhamnosyltransferase
MENSTNNRKQAHRTGTLVKASVVIPTKNPGSVFRKVLRAVLEQETSWPYEIIVIDSGSDDGTLEFIHEFSTVKLLEIAPNEFGHGKTRNFAISQSRGEYLAVITHDAMPANKKWLSELVSAADQDDQIAGVFGRHIAYPESSPFTQRELELHFSGFLSMQKVWLDDKERYFREEGYRQILHFFSDNNALLRRKVWEIIPYPDVDFAEDQAWAKKIIEAGYIKAYAHEAVVYHSHDYSLFERLQRSFDESFAFKRYFGYKLYTGFKNSRRSWVGMVRRDWRLWRTHFIATSLIPFDHFMRLLGHCLGTYGESIPSFIRKRLSRDNKLLIN